MSLNDNDPTFPNLGDLAGERAVLADLHDEMQRLAVLSGSIDDLLASVLDCSDEEFDGLQAKIDAALVDLKAARQRVHALMERLGEANATNRSTDTRQRVRPVGNGMDRRGPACRPPMVTVMEFTWETAKAILIVGALVIATIIFNQLGLIF